MALVLFLLLAATVAAPGWASLVAVGSAASAAVAADSSSPAATPAPSAGQPEDMGSPLRVAQCRARCLQRFSGGPNKETVCMQGPDCFMCWENCELLQSNYPVWGAMCTQKGICFPGCQQACKFHRETANLKQQIEPVIHTRGEEVVTVGRGDDDEGNVIRWQRPPAPRTSSVVYVVMTKEEGSVTWRQVTQTVDLEARLNDVSNSVGRLGDTGIRVLVVDPEGLVTIYSPVQTPVVPPPSPPSASNPTSAPADATSAPDATPSPSSASRDENGAGLREGKWLREDVTSPLDDAQHAMLFPTASAGDAVLQVSRGGPWSLREVSLIHQKVLVIAEVAWEARVSRGVYLVTWEVDGGGLKGNLFTDSTCVTLSLWPDTIYHIQVELVSHTAAIAGSAPDRSDPMVLDTHKASAVAVEPRLKPSAASPGADLSSGPIRFPIHLEQTDNDHEDEDEDDSEQRLGNGGATRRRRRRRREEQLEQMELVAGSGAALLLFLAVVAGLAWRCRSNRRLLSGADGSFGSSAFLESGSINKKKMVEDPLSTGFFQPIMTLVTEAARGTNRFGGGANGILSSAMEGEMGAGGKGEGRRQGGVAKEAIPTAHPTSASRLPTVSVRGLGDQLQHPDSYAAFLRQAERCARNEVQV